MTPHATQNFLDGSAAIRIYPGGRWTTRRGPTNGTGDIFDCDASRFCDEQNRWIRGFFRESVTRVRREGRP